MSNTQNILSRKRLIPLFLMLIIGAAAYLAMLDIPAPTETVQTEIPREQLLGQD